MTDQTTSHPTPVSTVRVDKEEKENPFQKRTVVDDISVSGRCITTGLRDSVHLGRFRNHKIR